ncbi:MAG: response regulator [Spirochaetota bacterium]|nr:response regulator [Spirochaetota bacterium]
MDASKSQSQDEHIVFNSSLFEFSPFPIIRINPQTEIINGSLSFESFIGKSLNDKNKKQNILFRYMSLSDNNKINEVISDLLIGKITFMRIGEIKITNANAEEKWANIILYPIIDSNNNIIAIEIILEDITRLKSLEKKINIMNKNQIMGNLTTGLVHSFSSIINSIKNEVKSIKGCSSKNIPLDSLSKIEKIASKGEKQINEIIDFIEEKEGVRKRKVKSLKIIIEDAINLAKMQFNFSDDEKNKKTIKFNNKIQSNVRIRSDIKLVNELIVSIIFRVSSYIRGNGTINIVLKSNNELSLNVSVLKEPNYSEANMQEYIPGIPEADIRYMAEKLQIKIFEEESSNSYSLKAVIPSGILINKVKPVKDTRNGKLKKLNVLLVGDKDQNRYLCSNIEKIQICDNYSRALSLFKRDKFDLIIANFQQSGISGLELLIKIKESDENVISVLIYDGKPEKLKAYKNIIDIYMPSSFSMNKLSKEISRISNSKKK